MNAQESSIEALKAQVESRTQSVGDLMSRYLNGKHEFDNVGAAINKLRLDPESRVGNDTDLSAALLACLRALPAVELGDLYAWALMGREVV